MSVDQYGYVEDAVGVIGKPWINAHQFLGDAISWMVDRGVKVSVSQIADVFTVEATCWRKPKYRITGQKTSLYNCLAWVVLKVDTFFKTDATKDVCPFCGKEAHGMQTAITGD